MIRKGTAGTPRSLAWAWPGTQGGTAVRRVVENAGGDTMIASESASTEIFKMVVILTLMVSEDGALGKIYQGSSDRSEMPTYFEALTPSQMMRFLLIASFTTNGEWQVIMRTSLPIESRTNRLRLSGLLLVLFKMTTSRDSMNLMTAKSQTKRTGHSCADFVDEMVRVGCAS